MLIWNKLVENKGPNELKKDQLNPDARLMELFKNESFKTFLESKTLDAKMVALRDAGIVNNDIIKDEDLARTLMETISYSLQEDPNVQSKKPTESDEGRTFGDYAKQTAGALVGGAIGGALGANVGGIPIGAAVGAHITRPDKDRIL